MDILGIGPLELVLVLLLALLIFGPEDLVATGRKLGRFFSKVIKSDAWTAVRSISREMRDLPNKLAREAELEELSAEIKKQTDVPTSYPFADSASNPGKPTSNVDHIKAWTSPPAEPEPEKEAAAPSESGTPSEDANENPPA